ncbi:ubiquitin carboxyl-terminal hydrolase 2 [Phyllosticta citriasiana]|uniref:ubiquitin carboxyl-terminal hydrolase 2 n=1 Tax=Phyllosticta citriasiana TaxID=595635 RepID=UPI0030FD5472
MTSFRPSSSGLPAGARGDNGPFQSNPTKALLHIDDLKARAEERLRDAPPTVDRLLAVAEQSTKQVGYLLDYRRPDFAYVEFLVASEIVFNLIPRHRDAPIAKGDRGTRYHRHKTLMKQLEQWTDQMTSVKDIIVNDNRRNGTLPRLSPKDIQARHTSLPALASGTTPYRTQRYSAQDELFLDTASMPNTRRPSATSEATSGRSTPLSAADSPRYRIDPSQAPTNGVNGLSTQGDALSERFARLRVGNQSSSRPSSIAMPLHTDYVNAPSGSSRVMGPRAMPNGVLPALPPKIPLDTRLPASMPKEPSPTYSPARNMQTPADIIPPRTTARSLARQNSIPASSPSAAPTTNGASDSYFPGSYNGAAVRRKSVHGPRELQISSEKLYDYLRRFNVLLIDVRNRQDFDDGHIYGKSIMCVEPTALRRDMSAEELSEALILSPDVEQEMFDRRDEFDLVVYYDQSTPDASFLTRHSRTSQEWILKYLYDGLYEFNAEKPLQRPPILLMGGVEAWADLLGTGALKTSATASIVSDMQSGRISRPVRRPVARPRYYMPPKLFDYNPLDAEEEKKFLEKARGERPTIDPSMTAEEEMSYYRSTEDFMRRFPEASAIEPQSMSAPRIPSRPPPRPPSRPLEKQVQYPGAVPAIPSRPPPAAPRVSYSGVHDRNHPANHVALQRTSQLPSYFPPSQLPQNLRLPRTGLYNFGVTCYMNATIQCLNATLPLTRVFRDGTFGTYIQRQNWRGSRGLMAETYATLVQNLWQENAGPVRPKTLRELSARMNREWGLDRQQDAKEYLDFILDLLHEDLNVNWAHPPAQALTEEEEARRERLPKAYVAHIEWLRWSMREYSIVSDLFAGQHLSRLRCLTCGHTSTTYETFYSISVEIPHNHAADIRDCLRSYCAEERLSGDEVWRCPRCKVEREATKKITITRAPHFLIIHFKRFSASHTERARKVRTRIEFPLTGLDISPFVLPPLTADEEQHLMRRADGAETLRNLKADDRMTPPYLYGAYAVMRHHGSALNGGHYTACLKDTARGCWWNFNDARVHDFQPDAVRGSDRLQSEDAYLVFYERERLWSADGAAPVVNGAR